MSETYNLYRQGQKHMAAGMNAQATVALEKAKRREPEKASIREALGIAYFRIRRFAEAEEEFRAILELKPVDDYAHFALGRCLEKQGRPEEARPLPDGDLLPSAERRLPAGARGSRSGVGSAGGRSARVGRARRRGWRRGRRDRGGLCVLLGVADTDNEEDARRLAGRTARLRIFENAEGKFDRSVLDTRGAVLVVSQFTLIADTAKGNRPSFSHAARAEAAEPLYEAFCNALEAEQIEVARGFRRAHDLQIENDGPVTIVLGT